MKTELHIPVALACKVKSVVADYNLPIKWHFGEMSSYKQTLFDLYKIQPFNKRRVAINVNDCRKRRMNFKLVFVNKALKTCL